MAEITEKMRQLTLAECDTVVIVVDCIDGRGDLEHFIAFALKIKENYPKTKMAAIIGVWAANTSLCNTLIKFLENHKNLFSILVVSVDLSTPHKGNSFYNLDPLYQEKIFKDLNMPFRNSHCLLESLNNKTLCILQISTAEIVFARTSEIKRWLESARNTQIPYFSFTEYGESRGTDRMGLRYNAIGIRLIEEWQEKITDEKRIKVLLEIKNTLFLQSLLLNKTPDETAGKAYLAKRRFLA